MLSLPSIPISEISRRAHLTYNMNTDFARVKKAISKAQRQLAYTDRENRSTRASEAGGLVLLLPGTAESELKSTH